MNFYVGALLSLTILIPAIIGLVRFKKINQAYYPFIICMWLGALNEIISLIIVFSRHDTIVTGNIYILVEFLVLAWQFKRWNLFERKSNWFTFIVVALVALWIAENFITSDILLLDSSYFSISYSVVLTFMSISMINHLIVTERRSLIKNPIFIICAAFILFYTLNVLSETFWIYGINVNKTFRESVYYITVITNFIAIIFYSLAILWMPIKQTFTLPSS